MTSGRPETMRVLHRDDTLVVATRGPIFVQRWLTQGQVQDFGRMAELHVRFMEERKDEKTLHMVHVTLSIVRPPSEAMRAVMSEHARRIEGRLSARAMVLETDGFAAALIRGLMSAFTLASRAGPREGVCATSLDGFRHLVAARPDLALNATTLDAQYRTAIG